MWTSEEQAEFVWVRAAFSRAQSSLSPAQQLALLVDRRQRPLRDKQLRRPEQVVHLCPGRLIRRSNHCINPLLFGSDHQNVTSFFLFPEPSNSRLRVSGAWLSFSLVSQYVPQCADAELVCSQELDVGDVLRGHVPCNGSLQCAPYPKDTLIPSQNFESKPARRSLEYFEIRSWSSTAKERIQVGSEYKF